MAWTIANCIVTREFIVVTYSNGSPDFHLSGGSGKSTNFVLDVPQGTVISLPSKANFTFYSSIPATVISWPSPKLPAALEGKSFSLTITDDSVNSGTFTGTVSPGGAELVALLLNQLSGPVANAAAGAISTAASIVSGAISGPGNNTVTGAISSAASTMAGAFNAPTFPILTEEIGYPPSPLARPSGGNGGMAGGAALGQVVNQALNSVLGWKVKTDDPKGFVGALNASFTCKEIEGHTECTWQQRSVAVQTDLSGGITGAQASLYTRAQDALDQSLPLLDGLYPLNPAADVEDVAAYREVVRNQLTQLVSELGYLGGPRVYRVDQYFGLLLGITQLGPNIQAIPPNSRYTPYTAGSSPTKPPSLGTSNSDLINGSLGNLRDLYAIYTTGPTSGIPRRGSATTFSNPYINSVPDEQDTANFRTISDYVTSLAQSWINNYAFFGIASAQPFFGTQLVQITRQFSVVAEDVDEVRFALDSVFIGPDERQTLAVYFGPQGSPQSSQVQMYFEDFASWVQTFASDDGPQLIQQSGIYAAGQSVFQVANLLSVYAGGCLNNPANTGLPLGFGTQRVQQTLQQLGDDLLTLVTLLTPYQNPQLPPP